MPFLGDFLGTLVSGHNILVYVALLAVPLTGFVLFSTAFGLRLRAVGEAPEAVDSAGYSVAWLRYRAVIIAGVLCGIAGAYLSTAHGGGFVREMSAGKGYIALAALIFGKWRPVPTLFACLLFGALESSASRLSNVGIAGDRRDPRRCDPDRALRADGGAAGRLLRQGDPAAGAQHSLREGTLSGSRQAASLRVARISATSSIDGQRRFVAEALHRERRGGAAHTRSGPPTSGPGG